MNLRNKWSNFKQLQLDWSIAPDKDLSSTQSISLNCSIFN